VIDLAEVEIIDADIDNIKEFGVCGYKNMKKPGFPDKYEWLKKRFGEGLKMKILYSQEDGPQGMIEYIPGEYCWRPVDAKGFMFIHCLFSGFKRKYQRKGYGQRLLGECMRDAKKGKMQGIAVVTRKGSFMVGNEIFLKNGFEAVGRAPPDFELLVKKFDKKAPTPRFKVDLDKIQSKYGKGLTIIRADQCPYTVKNVQEIAEKAKTYGLKPRIIDLKNHKEAQNSPCAFGTFCMILDGKALSHHPISSRRFQNIMDKELK
jgi:GNAT superfamily N-acetyltransferase